MKKNMKTQELLDAIEESDMCDEAKAEISELIFFLFGLGGAIL